MSSKRTACTAAIGPHPVPTTGSLYQENGSLYQEKRW